MASGLLEKKGLRVAIEGCGHGTLNSIYASIKKSCELKGWDGVDLLIIGGDFQAVRNAYDMNTISMPAKYRELGDFHEYYSGARTAPYLTIFVGGNHEASNYLWELYYGGWVAPNIYYMGAANVVRVGPLRIAGLSGIWKGYDYKKPHHERLPYNSDDVKSIYHVREIDTLKLLQLRTQIDIGISHDWPRAIEWSGDSKFLFRKKPDFEQESKDGTLGSVAARHVIDWLRPAYWFSAHMHIKFPATVDWEKKDAGRPQAAAQVDSLAKKSSTVPTSSEREPNAGVNGDLQHVEASVKNEEEIDLDLDDEDGLQEKSKDTESTDQAAVHLNTNGTSETIALNGINPEQAVTGSEPTNGSVPNNEEIDLGLDVEDESESKKRKRTSSEDGGAQRANDEEKLPVNQDLREAGFSVVSEDLRAQLPAAFSKPAREPSPAIYDQTPPPTITNNKTYFLALDKCLPNRDFLQILHIEPISEQASASNWATTESTVSEAQNPSEPVPKEPVTIQYDKEWLAITRVFSQEQPPNSSPFSTLPPKRDRAYYLPLILQQEAWIDQNVTDLTIPANFAHTAPLYDPSLGLRVEGMPREYPNPGTRAFCELIQIPNHFDATEEEIQARIDAGPRPERENNHRGGFRGRGGRGGGHGGGKGGRGGNARRGRGGGHGGSRGRRYQGA